MTRITPSLASTLCACLLACTALHSTAHAQGSGEGGPFLLKGSGTSVTSVSAPLPPAQGMYRFDSFYLFCQALWPNAPGDALPGIAYLQVAAGPDKGLVIELPAGRVSGNPGGGALKFYLQAGDQIQINWQDPSISCKTYLYGEQVSESLQVLE